MNASLAISVVRVFQKCLDIFWKMMYVQADTGFRGIPTVMDGLLKLLADFWVCELSWIALYCCEASEWVLRLTRGVCSWDCMSSQKGERDRISVGHVERIRKEKVWKCTEPSLLEIPVSPIFQYSCENRFLILSVLLYLTSVWEMHGWSVPYASRNFLHAELQCVTLLVLESV